MAKNSQTAGKGSQSCVLIGKLISVIFEFSSVDKGTCKQYRVRKYRLSVFLFNAELGCIEINA